MRVRYAIGLILAGARRCSIVFAILLLAFWVPVFSQKIAILVPEDSPQAEAVANELATSLAIRATVIDSSLADAAFRSVRTESPFNLTLEDGKRIGSVIGCDAFLLIKAESLRRTSSARSSYFESYAAIFAVGTRTGHLVSWVLRNSENDIPGAAEKELLETLRRDEPATIKEILKSIAEDSTEPKASVRFTDLPANGSNDAKGFRPPIPYRRDKPEYTSLAYIYDVKGTVEIAVDLDEKGSVIATEITRWAGFGLEDSVIRAVRKMNWRPAERDGKPLPSRFLLRYNFKKIEKE